MSSSDGRAGRAEWLDRALRRARCEGVVRFHRSDIVERAVDILDMYGLPDLSMRRIASELGLQPSALYHHFANKQALLAAVADELLERGRRPDAPVLPWDARVIALSSELRDAMLAYRDGAELIVAVHAFGLGAASPAARLTAAISGGDSTWSSRARQRRRSSTSCSAMCRTSRPNCRPTA